MEMIILIQNLLINMINYTLNLLSDKMVNIFLYNIVSIIDVLQIFIIFFGYRYVVMFFFMNLVFFLIFMGI